MIKLFRSGWFVALLTMLMLTAVASCGGKTGLAGDAEALGDVLLDAQAEAEADAQADDEAEADADADAAQAEADAQAAEEAFAEELLADEEVQSALEAAEAALCAEYGGDPRVRPASVDAMLDRLNEVWFQVKMCAVLGIEPPPELFSAFTKILASWNPTVEIGWEKHAGDDYVLGTTAEAYILDDGTVLIATGLFPTGDYQLEIEVEFGSWEDESESTPVFGDASFVIDSEAVGAGDDPFVYFGAEPVYDLVAGE